MFIDEDRGAIAIPAAIGCLMMVAALGVAFDTSRLVTERHTLQAIADVAALASAGPENASSAEREKLAKSSVAEYLSQTGESLNVSMSQFDVARNGESVSITLASQKDLVFGGIIGMNSYTVKASATAEEVTSTEQAGAAMGVLGTAVSFVVDASSKPRGVTTPEGLGQLKKAIASELAIAQANGDAIKTGVYPFNWGVVETGLSPLQTGSDAALAALNTVAAAQGSVPSSALEAAVSDQRIDQTRSAIDDRYVVFALDGEIDLNKGDRPGEVIPANQIVGIPTPAACLSTPPDLIRAQDELAQYILKSKNDFGLTLTSWTGPGIFDDDKVKYDSGDTLAEGTRKRKLLLRMAQEVLVRDGGLSLEAVVDDTLGQTPIAGELSADLRENLGFVGQENNILIREQDAFEQFCMPQQEERIFDACEAAKADNVKVVGLNMSGEYGPASQTLRQCVFGDLPALAPNEPVPSGAQAIVAALGADKVQVAPDGSVYIVVSDKTDIQDTVRSLLALRAKEIRTSPGETVRSVRLVR